MVTGVTKGNKGLKKLQGVTTGLQRARRVKKGCGGLKGVKKGY